MQRETATELKDLPHAFAGLDDSVPCRVCAGARADEKHEQWQRVESASRETAADNKTSDFRELGS